MGSREVPFDEHTHCDRCGFEGAFDFMGDYFCGECAKELIGEPEPCNRCGNKICRCGE